MSMANLKIFPDYNYTHTCHFCKNRVAVESKEKMRKCYYFDKVFHLNGVAHKYSYRIAEVAVPRCETCEKHENKSSSVNAIIFLICFILGVYIWSGIFAETDGTSRTWTNILIACGPSFFCSLIITYITGLIIDSIFERKYNFNMDCDGYAPIRRLKIVGYVPRDSAPGSKSYDVKERGPLNVESYRKALVEIANIDKCKITNL